MRRYARTSRSAPPSATRSHVPTTVGRRATCLPASRRSPGNLTRGERTAYAGYPADAREADAVDHERLGARISSRDRHQGVTRQSPSAMMLDLETGPPPPNRVELTSVARDMALVALIGEHDLGHYETLKAVLARAALRAPNVVVDLSECAFVDSTVLQLML